MDQVRVLAVFDRDTGSLQSRGIILSGIAQRVETRGWIFTPPSPEQPISSLFEHLTTQQLVGLGDVKRRTA